MDAHKHISGLEPLLAESSWLRRLSRGLVQDEADADDVVQDTWVAALRGHRRVSTPRAWIGSVARRTAARQRRSARRRGDHEALSGPALVEPKSPAETAERLELAAILAEALRELPEPYRGALYEHYYEGDSASVIAERAGIPAGTVRWRLSQGRGLLRDRLRARDGRSWDSWAMALAPLTGAGGSASPTAATLASLGTIMSIKITVMGICAGALAAGGAWFVEAPPAGVALQRAPEPPAVTLGARAAEAAGVDALHAPTAAMATRTAGTTSSADGLFGIVAFGRVTDPSGDPLSEVTVQLELPAQAPIQARTDDRGGWSVVGVKPGEYGVTLSRAGSLTVRDEVTVPDAPSWRYDVTLVDAMSIPVRFESPDGEALKTDGFQSSAQFLGVAATPDPPPERMRILGRMLSRSESARFLARAERSTPPDLNARYQGLLQLNAEPPLWATVVYRDVVLESRLLAGGEEELVFIIPDLAASNGSVRVRVVDRDTGELLTEGFTLNYPSGGPPVAPRVDQGALVFDSVPPGTMDLEGRMGQYERFEREVQVNPGAEFNVGTIELGRAAPFKVRTIDAAGEPLQIRVFAVRPDIVAGPHDLDLRVGTQPNVDGVTEVTWLAPGRTLVRAGGRDGRALVALEVDTQETQQVELVVPDGIDLTIEGLTMDTDEFFVLENSAGAPLRSGQRAYRAFCLAPGSYVMRVLAGEIERSRASFSVDAATTTIDLGTR